MSFEVTYEDTYTLFDFGEGLPDEKTINRFEAEIDKNIQKGKIFILVNLSGISLAEKRLVEILDTANDELNAENGSLVVAADDDSVAASLEEKSIITAPTLSEAIDYILMEAIEKQLNNEEDSDDWE
jgi:hypothetical protein